MNKEEIQNKIDSISADRDALERTRNKLTGDIALLLEQIAEAEKPKLRHGDFGLDAGNLSGGNWVHINGKTYYPSGVISGLSPTNNTILEEKIGNIFDLTKDWGEPFENYYKYGIRIEISNVDDIYIDAGGSHLTIPKAEEIWHKLGQVIAQTKKG